MEGKPGDFFIGVVSFFAVLLPGALLAFFTAGLAATYAAARPDIFGSTITDCCGEAKGWVIFIVASYVLGQFVSLLGSPLDKVYDRVRSAFLSKRIKNRWISRQWLKNEILYKEATRIKVYYLKDSPDEKVNAFQWSKAVIQLRYPASAPEIYRLEADQKFFRGLIVVLLIICLIFIISRGAGLAELTPYLILLVLSFWRYVDQRRKSTNLAYTYLIALEKMPKVPTGNAESEAH